MIRKAVIPAAGFGTRFLPASKAQPKEMLPVVDKPVIQYVVEEAVDAGATDILIVISEGKESIERHFRPNIELERALEKKGRHAELAALRKIAEMANIRFTKQQPLKGLGEAVSCARSFAGNDPFLLLLGDTLIESESNVCRALSEVYERFKASAVAVAEVPSENLKRYGVISGKRIDDSILLVEAIVEKPDPKSAPSNLAVAARYVFTPEIFECIAQITPRQNEEIQLTDAMQTLVQREKLYALRIDGRRHDIGDKLEFLKANLIYGLKHHELGAAFAKFAATLVPPR